MSFPRYQIGDIICESAKRKEYHYKDQADYHYLIIDKKIEASQDNMADLYLTICLDNGKVCDRIFQDSIYHLYKRVA